MQEKTVCKLLAEARDLFFEGDRAGYEARMAQARRLIGDGGEARWLLGEWTLLTSLPQMRDPAALLRVYDEALSLMGGRRCVIMTAGDQPSFSDDSVLWMMLQEPGTADRQGRLFFDALERYRDLTGIGQGYAELFRAELAYQRGDLIEARVQAYQAAYIAQSTQQKRLAISAAKQIGYLVAHSLDMRDWSFAVKTVADIALGDKETFDLSDPIVRTANMVRCEMLLLLNDFETLPEWLKEGSFGAYEANGIFDGRFRVNDPNISFFDYPKAIWLHAMYLLYTRQYARALAADTVQRMFGIEDSLLCYRIYFGLLRGICYLRLCDRDRAWREILAAVRLAAPDGLWLTVGMFAPASDGLVTDAVRAVGGDAAAVQSIGRGFRDNWQRLREAVAKTDIERLLTQREREVSRLVAAGLRNREIAERLNITEQTVKFHISNIYAKLEIDNRSKLVARIKSYTKDYTKV